MVFCHSRYGEIEMEKCFHTFFSVLVSLDVRPFLYSYWDLDINKILCINFIFLYSSTAVIVIPLNCQKYRIRAFKALCLEPNSSRSQHQWGPLRVWNPSVHLEGSWGVWPLDLSVQVTLWCSAQGCTALGKRGWGSPEIVSQPCLRTDTIMCLHKLVGCLYPTLNLKKPLMFQLWIPLFSFSSSSL